MPRGVVHTTVKEEAIRLRTKDRRSLREISQVLGVSKSCLSAWLRPFPLSDEEMRVRKVRPNLRQLWEMHRKERPSESVLHKSLGQRQMTPAQKGKIAEAAILLRLLLHEFNVHGPVFDGDRVDWIAEVPETGRLLKVQVKCVIHYKNSWSVSLVRTEGHNRQRRLADKDFDFVVGYDLFSDLAYVWSRVEVGSLRKVVSISPDAVERWDKLRSGQMIGGEDG